MRKQKAGPSRRVRRKSGSIMIMVVALLVLMALIGTAYIATARYDRGSAVQSANNVQIDILMEGVENLCKTAVAGDLFDGYGNYRPLPRDPFKAIVNNSPDPLTAPIPIDKIADAFFYYNLTSTQYDPNTNQRLNYWIADRTPSYSNSPARYFWPRISLPLTTEFDATSPVRSYFEDPTYYPQNPGQPLNLRFHHDGDLVPQSKLVNGVPMPSFLINTSASANGLFAPNTNNASLGASYNALAADADGDGIADSFLVRMPIGNINGITYYYAVRIVDNAAAINLNTAWADRPLDPATNNPISFGAQFLPTSINVVDLIPGNASFKNQELNRLRMFRTQGFSPYNPNSGLPVDLKAPRTDGDPMNAVASTVRKDFEFLNEHDAMWMQLGRRPENPGYIPNGTTAQHYRAFPLSDTLALSSHFVLNYQYDLATAEDVFFNSKTLGGPRLNGTGAVRTTPYAPYDVMNDQYSWGPQNFWYESTPSGFNQDYSRRPLVVVSNSVSNAIAPHQIKPADVFNHNIDKLNPIDVPTSDMLNYVSDYRGDWQKSDTYHQGDVVRVGNDYYVCSFSNSSDANNAPNIYGGRKYWEYQPWTPTPQKASLNTASFRELYRAYWNVMCGTPSNTTPFGTTTVGNNDPYTISNNPQKQFKSSLRDVRRPFGAGTYRFSPFQQLLLRSALAAINTIDIRDSDDDVTVRHIYLNIEGETLAGNTASRPVEVTLYGCEKQPFITEIYAHADNSTIYSGQQNKMGYVAIELFNPYDTPIKMANWKLGLIDRRRPIAGQNSADPIKHTIRALNYTFPANLTIPAGGYLVLHNHKNTPGDPNQALVLPPKVTVTGTPQYVQDLYKVFENEVDTTQVGGELVLLRPRRADGKTKQSPTVISQSDPLQNGGATGFNETFIYDMVPVDSFDFTGLKLHKPGINSATVKVDAWHYVRENDKGSKRWKCVYPGPYNAGKDPDTERHKVEPAIWDAPIDPAKVGDATDPNYRNSLPAHTVELGKEDNYSTYTNNYPAIEINNRDAAGFYPITGPTDPNNPYPGGAGTRLNKFPFGGFMRVGDVMQVPFIGAYRVREITFPPGGPQLKESENTFLELNCLPMDSFFAEDGDNSDDTVENIGRFCPILKELAPGTTNTHYDFAKRIFDYFTVIAPHDDYFPNINPDRSVDPVKDNTTAYRFYDSGGKYKPLPEVDSSTPPATPTNTYFAPEHAEPVKNIDRGTAADVPEDNVGVHGLININTANWKVISTIPFTGTQTVNEKIAKGIVLYRDGDPASSTLPQGPFQSLFDLYKVPEFLALSQSIPQDPDDGDGDYSPFNQTLTTPPANPPTTDQVNNKNAFEREYLMINRISNLITTRSDSFTAYILVQGWRNPNTPNAELVVQRRAAMLIDRAGVTATNREPRTMLIPVE